MDTSPSEELELRKLMALGLQQLRSKSDYSITSPESIKYNCIAWAAEGESCKMNRIWDPDGFYWPKDVERQPYLPFYIQAFESEGFRVCKDRDGNCEEVERIVLFLGNENCVWHAARQLSSGKWTSKLGKKWEDIEHRTPELMNCNEYGEATVYMSRKRPKIGN